MNSATSCTRLVRIVNQKGLHARPCGAIVSTALRFQADLRVRVGSEGRLVNGKSILDLITLAAAEGAELELQAQGPDAALLVASIEALVAAGFHEGP
jgi:phosphocarrier protein